MRDREATKALGLFGLRDDEWRRAWPLGVGYASLLAAIYVLKPVRAALFLSQVGSASLPFLLVLMACVSAGGGVLFSWLTRTVAPPRIALWLLPSFALGLVGFRFALSRGMPSFAFAFSLWVNLLGNLSAALVWLLANAWFNAREARKAFALIGALGIAGAVLGGTLTEYLSGLWGAVELLWVAALLLLLAIACVRWRGDPPPAPRASRRAALPKPGLIAELEQSSLLRQLSLLAITGAMTSAFIDVQFNIAVEARYSTPEAQAAALGRFFSWLNIAALAFQLLVSPRILQRWGVAGGLVTLPAVIATAALGVPALSPIGWVGSGALKACDVGLRHSLYKSALEIALVPLLSSTKQRAKFLLDATLDNLGTGLAAVVLLVLGGLATGSTLSFLCAGFATAWAIAAVSVRRSYLAEFRRSVELRQLRPEALTQPWNDATQRNVLLAALQSPHLRDVHYALDLLEGVEDNALVAPLCGVLLLPDARARARSLALLSPLDAARALPRVRELFTSAAAEECREALYFIAVHEGDLVGTLRRGLLSDELRLQVAALQCIASYAPHVAWLLSEPAVDSTLRAAQGPLHAPLRTALAQVLACAPLLNTQPSLEHLLRDSEASVVHAAMHSVGQLRRESYLPLLIERLAVREHRRAAQHALAKFGAVAVPHVCAALDVQPRNTALDRAIPGLLARINNPVHLRMMLLCALRMDPVERLSIQKALNRARENDVTVRWNRTLVRDGLLGEVAWQTTLREFQRQLRGSGANTEPLLGRVVRERVAESLERMFRWLGLLYPPRDVYAAYLGLAGSDAPRRAMMAEFLEQLIEARDRKLVFPFLDTGTKGSAPAKSDGLNAVSVLLSKDAWLKSCTVFALRRAGARAAEDAATSQLWEQLQEDASAWVREARTAPLNEGWGASPEGTNSMLTIVERVILLQHVDVLAEVASEHLALVATIAEQMIVPSGTVVYREHDVPDAMYVVLEGSVRLSCAGTEIASVSAGGAFGTWALFDDELRVATATTGALTRLLRVAREDFSELLADNAEITRGVLKAVARRLRGVAARVGPTSNG